MAKVVYCIFSVGDTGNVKHNNAMIVMINNIELVSSPVVCNTAGFL